MYAYVSVPGYTSSALGVFYILYNIHKTTTAPSFCCIIQYFKPLDPVMVPYPGGGFGFQSETVVTVMIRTR